MSNLSDNSLKSMIDNIILTQNLPYFQKINALTKLYEENKDNMEKNQKSGFLILENAIEEQFDIEIRRLNAIRENNLDVVHLEDIVELKKGFSQLFDSIENTLSWNADRHQSMYGAINRASLRAMMIDPEVSVKTKQEIMDNWDDYL